MDGAACKMAEEFSAYLRTQGMFLEWNLRTIKGKMKSVVVVVAEGGSARSERGNGGIRASEGRPSSGSRLRPRPSVVRLIKVAAPPPQLRRLIRFFALPRAPCRSRCKVPKMQLKFLTKNNDVWKNSPVLKLLEQYGMSL